MTEHRRRRAVQSSLGRIDLGEVKDQGVLKVDNPEDNQREIMQPITRQWTAGNPDMEGIENQIEEARRLKYEAKNRASKAAMQRLEVLVEIGRLTSEVVIGKVTFSLRSLKSKEIQDVMERAVQAGTNIGEALAIRNNTLAYSIYQIDGQPTFSYVQSHKAEDMVNLIGELEESVVLKLWSEYSNMLEAHQSNLTKDLGETAEETVENVKKL